MNSLTHPHRLTVRRALLALAGLAAIGVGAPAAAAHPDGGECAGPCSVEVRLGGTGTGTVTSVSVGLACPSLCSISVAAGTEIVLTARAAPGSTFSRWGGCSPLDADPLSCRFSVGGPTVVTARFDGPGPPPPTPLEVGLHGSGTGSVTSAPAGIACKPDCRASFPEETQVTLTAVPGPGSTFAGWSGDCVPLPGPGVRCVAELSESRFVGADFRADTAPPSSGCTLTGTPGDDTLRGTPGPDVICGLAGNDLIQGLGGNDIISAGPGDDEVHGGAGRDRIDGGPGHDHLHGEAGNDRLTGGAGPDELYGGAGNDRLNTRDGAVDELEGGRGSDTCRADRIDRLRAVERRL